MLFKELEGLESIGADNALYMDDRATYQHFHLSADRQKEKTMKKKLVVLASAVLICVIQPSMAEEKIALDKGKHHHHQGMPTEDKRISLNLAPAMKQHQLANMRNHLDAVRRIIEAVSTDQFEAASQIASEDLGLTTRMEGMCNSFENESFKELALTFHKSGDELAAVLKSGNAQKSLQALNETMTFCVNCHATYRQ